MKGILASFENKVNNRILTVYKNYEKEFGQIIGREQKEKTIIKDTNDNEERD